MNRLLALLLVFLGLAGAAATGPALADTASPRVLVMGDSLLSSNRMLGGAVAQVLAQALGVPVTDQSVAGARHLFAVPLLAEAGLKIGAQYGGGTWDYVVMNGGGNDLLFGCGCGACTRVMDRLVSADGTSGAIPKLVAQVRAGGARVIYTGYMRTPGLTSPVESCGPLGDEMDRRLTRMAALDDGVRFVPLAGLVTKDGDRSYHGIDLVHPSLKGSREIAAKVLSVMAP